MNEASGNALEAVSGLDMAAVNAPGATTGVINGARSFVSGSSQYFTRADDVAFQLGASGTIAVWVYIADKTLQRGILGRGPGSAGVQDYYMAYINGAPGPSTDRIIFFYRYSGGNTTNRTIVVSPTASTWYLCAVKWDGANIYVSANGAAWSNTGAETHAPISNGSAVPAIGAGVAVGPTFNAFMNGNLDALTHWKNTLLSDTEIATFYNAAAGHEFNGTIWV